VARANNFLSNFGAMELRAVRPYEKAGEEREAKGRWGAESCWLRAKDVCEFGLRQGGLFGWWWEPHGVGNREEMKHPLRGLDEEHGFDWEADGKGRVAGFLDRR